MTQQEQNETTKRVAAALKGAIGPRCVYLCVVVDRDENYQMKTEECLLASNLPRNWQIARILRNIIDVLEGREPNEDVEMLDE